jgi:polyhydroxyalkanoate synthesis repressor PhaR
VKSDTVIIKKYGNRRLYDTSASRYVNLEEIATLVRHGKEVRVVDAKTGEDLTRVTLTQIIVEDARVGPTGLPLDLLRQLIVASDRVGREFVMWYLNSAFNAYQKVQESLESGLSEVRSAALSPLQMMKGSLQGDSAESQALRKRIAELQARLKKPVRRRKRRKASR